MRGREAEIESRRVAEEEAEEEEEEGDEEIAERRGNTIMMT